MMATTASNSVITIARYLIGVGSVIGLAVSIHVEILLWSYLSEMIRLGGPFNDVGMWMIRVYLACSPVGFLLVSDFCLRRWRIMERREGAE